MNYTPKQLQILELIYRFQKEHGYSPTYAELAQELKVSTITVFEHLAALEHKGAVRRRRHEARSVEITDQQFLRERAPNVLPLMGRLIAGQPIETLESRQELPVGGLFACQDNSYILEVRGETMTSEHICDGDFVVVEERNSVDDGALVVVLLPSGEAAIKRACHEGGRVRLQTPSSEADSTYADGVEIRGVVRGVIRRCR